MFLLLANGISAVARCPPYYYSRVFHSGVILCLCACTAMPFCKFPGHAPGVI